MAMYDLRSGRSIGELFKDLTSETSVLIRQELQLARTELGQKATVLGRDAAVIAMGAALAYAGLLGAAAAAVLGLVRADIAPWLAATIVALALLTAGGVMVGTRLAAMKRRSHLPRQTLASVKETAAWLKNEIR
jgi:Putative Actinobacterial Holin-X, holin superfamily III